MVANFWKCHCTVTELVVKRSLVFALYMTHHIDAEVITMDGR